MSPKPRTTKPIRNKVQGAAPPAGPSSPIVAPAPPAFGSGPIANSTFDFTPANDEETNALARLKRKEDELTTIKTQYHDLLVERDEKIEELEKAVKSSRTEQSNVRKERDDLARDVQGYKQNTDAAVAAKKKAEEDLKFQKGVAEIDREDAEKLRKQLQDRDKKITAQNQVAVKFQERISEQAATLSELHKRVDEAEKEKEQLQIANANLAVQHEGTANDVSKATQEFENMFKDLGRDLDLGGYVGHVRDLLGSGQLKRDDSSHSLQRQLSPQKSNQDLPSTAGKSLLDQLAAADDGGSERSIPINGDEDDDDPTLVALGLGRVWDQHEWFVQLQNQEKKITDLMRRNEELQAQVNSQPQQAATAAPISTQPTPQKLGLSTIRTLETEPIEGEQSKQTMSPISVQRTNPNFDFSTIYTLETVPIAGESTSSTKPLSANAMTQTLAGESIELLQAGSAVREATKPTALSGVLVFVLMALNILFLISNGCERWVWMAANDMTRNAVVRAGSSNGLASLLSPVLSAIDRAVGVNNGVLG